MAPLQAFEEYKEKLKTAKLNMKNATKYVECFMARDDLTPQLKKITDDALIVVGAKARHTIMINQIISDHRSICFL